MNVEDTIEKIMNKFIDRRITILYSHWCRGTIVLVQSLRIMRDNFTSQNTILLNMLAYEWNICSRLCQMQNKRTGTSIESFLMNWQRMLAHLLTYTYNKWYVEGEYHFEIEHFTKSETSQFSLKQFCLWTMSLCGCFIFSLPCMMFTGGRLSLLNLCFIPFVLAPKQNDCFIKFAVTFVQNGFNIRKKKIKRQISAYLRGDCCR